MNNDILYLIAITLGTISTMIIIISKHNLHRIIFLALAGIMFTQAGICVYKGINGLHIKKVNIEVLK